MTSNLTIGQVSKRTGCNIETIRYYERIGLLADPPRTEGGHRIYDAENVKELAFILRSRELGFSIDEIRSLMLLADGHEGTCDQARDIAIEHADQVQRKINDLRKMEKKLRKMASECVGDAVPTCPVIDTLYRES